jgi:hypothetical protein
LQRNRRHRDLWPGREAALDLVERRVAWRMVEAMSARLDPHRDEIRIVE